MTSSPTPETSTTADSTDAPDASPLSFPPVTAPDAVVEANVKAAMTQNPRGMSFGRLAGLGAWVASCQGSTPPQPIRDPRVVVFAGDHGIASRGVSAFTPEASVMQAAEIDNGAAPVNSLAMGTGASVRLIDVSLDHGGTSRSETHVRDGAGAIDVEDAMTADEFRRAAEVGMTAADREIDTGADLIIAGDLGVGNTTVAAAVMGTLTFSEPVVAVGRGSGINDEVWKTKVAAVRDTMFRARTIREDVTEVLRSISAPDFVALVSFIAQCAVRRTPVLIDGAYTSVAAYVAERLAPGTKQWLAAGQLSQEPSHVVCLQALDLTPIVALDMTTGQAAGGVAALPILASAVNLVREEMNAQTGQPAQ